MVADKNAYWPQDPSFTTIRVCLPFRPISGLYPCTYITYRPYIQTLLFANQVQVLVATFVEFPAGHINIYMTVLARFEGKVLRDLFLYLELHTKFSYPKVSLFAVTYLL